LFEGIVSQDGSTLDLASSVTVNGAGHVAGFADTFTLTVCLLFISLIILLRSDWQLSKKFVNFEYSNESPNDSVNNIHC